MKKILLIDDDAGFRSLLVEWLQAKDFYPIPAEDGFTGIKLAQLHQPDLVLCDFNMPLLNGIEVLIEFNNEADLACIPFFFLTSKTDLALSQMKQLGASGIISKMDIDSLCRILAEIQAQ